MPYRVLKMTATGNLDDNMVRTKRRAMEIAQSHVKAKGDSAEIVRFARGEETVVMRYWRDQDGLGYIEY
jgi:hypothetical protein